MSSYVTSYTNWVGKQANAAKSAAGNAVGGAFSSAGNGVSNAGRGAGNAVSGTTRSWADGMRRFVLFVEWRKDRKLFSASMCFL